MAYSASVSLRFVIERFFGLSTDELNRIPSPESIQILHRLYEMAESMRDCDFEEICSAGGEYLEKQIRDSLWRAEDAIESYWLSLLHSSESENSEEDMDSTNPSNFSQDIQDLVQEIESGMERMKMFVHDHKPNWVLSSIDYSTPKWKNKIVGLCQELEKLKRILLRDFTHLDRLCALGIHGMGGIGKTSLAISFYNDSDVRKYFSIGAWIKISIHHCVRDILLSLLHTMEVFNHGKDEEITRIGLIEDNIEELAKFVFERLASERYLLVVDCLCDINISSWNYIKSILPDSNNGSRIILVNRWKFVDIGFVMGHYAKQLLDKSQSWELLREKVFGDEPCSHVFERIGKSIAQNCGGLPLAIITVGSHLAREEKTVEYWNKIADSGNSLAYAADGAPMFEQLGLSYKQMPQFLRPVFLYLSVFPESYGIDIEETTSLMLAEGLSARKELTTVENNIIQWFHYFKDRHLILPKGDSTLCLHHAVWYLCRNLAHKDEFFHIMNMEDEWEDFPPSMKVNNVRRLVVPKNVLLGVSDMFKLENSVHSSIRSILLTGPRHPYPLNICWGMCEMLRVLDARTICFYGFPVEILSLVLLRHLAMTLKQVEVPREISKLRNLRFLILLLRMKLVSFGGAPSYLPMEIWEMRQLIRLTAEGCDLPVPSHSDAQLPNLWTLHGVSPHSCTKEILERIPNLEILGITINLAPTIDVDAAPLRPFDHIIHLRRLQMLVCDISNPYFGGYPQPQVMSIPDTIEVPMNSLIFVNLSGCGLPWTSIEPITHLPALKSLRLQHQAFRGPKWELSNESFKQLQLLFLEDLDLVYWTTRSEEIFPCLRDLSITRCHKLQQIPHAFKNWGNIQNIEVVDSSREVETWARSVQLEPFPKGGRKVVISSPRGASTRTN